MEEGRFWPLDGSWDRKWRHQLVGQGFLFLFHFPSIFYTFSTLEALSLWAAYGSYKLIGFCDFSISNIKHPLKIPLNKHFISEIRWVNLCRLNHQPWKSIQQFDLCKTVSNDEKQKNRLSIYHVFSERSLALIDAFQPNLTHSEISCTDIIILAKFPVHRWRVLILHGSTFTCVFPKEKEVVLIGTA